MNSLKLLLCAGVASALLISPLSAQDTPFAKEIKARKAVMQVYSFNLGLMSAMAKGEADYDAETAVNAAWNLNVAAMMKNGPMWPQGSGNDAVENTRALPEAWTTWPKSAEYGEQLVEASSALVKVAGNGLDAMKGAMGDVGKSCKGCHDDFRAKKK